MFPVLNTAVTPLDQTEMLLPFKFSAWLSFKRIKIGLRE